MIIRGVVQTENNHPLADAQVLVKGANGAVLAQGVTDGGGRFQFEAPGAVNIQVFPPGWGTKVENVSYLPHVYRIEGVPRPSSTDVTISLRRAYPLRLLAYDQEGNKLEGRTEKSVAALNPVPVFLLTLDEMPLHGTLHWSEDDAQPTLLAPAGEPFILNLLWTAPGYGRLMCTADNDGRGFVTDYDGDGQLFLNVELAKTAWKRLHREMRVCRDGGYQLSDTFDSMVEKARESFNAMLEATDDATRASHADRALGATLHAGEILVMERAKQRIERQRRKTYKLSFQGPGDKNLSGATIRYRQVEHAFRFGLFINPHTHPIQRVPLDSSPLWEQVRRMGINQLPMAILWPKVEPERGVMTEHVEYDVWPAHELRKAGFTMKSHVSVWFWHGNYPDQWGAFVPTWAYDLTLDEIKEAVYKLIKSLMKKYYPHVEGWQAINEAMLQHTNALNLNLEQHVQVVGEVVRAIRETAPDAPIEVNNCQVFGEWINPTVVEQGYERVPDEFYRSLADNGVEYDVVGMQLYYGGYMYAGLWKGGFAIRHPWDIEAIINRYARLGKPINVSEVSVPSSHPRPEWGLDLGYWHGPWSLERQAEWVELFYTLCYSIPQVQEITWWNPTDEGAFIRDGGLLFNDYTPKPAADKLSELTNGWLTSGTATIGDDLSTSITGSAGTYEVTIEKDGEIITQTEVVLGQDKRAVQVNLP